jgi:predicted enzyme related to lactoylglutathione lyase
MSIGTFVWHELTTDDPVAAKSFYTQIAPWETKEWDDSIEYTMWTRGEKSLGGVVPLSAELKTSGVGPHWMPYVAVYDVDETVRRAASLGGRVRMGPKEVASIGAWAVIADPQGAVVGVFEPIDAPSSASDGAIGDFSWHELATSDYKAASEFYRALFKWDATSDFDMGEMGIYRMFGKGGKTFGGMFNRRDDMPAPNWLSYVRVDSVKPVADKVRELGGTVFNGPMEVPGGDWVAQCIDPQGAAVALHAK